MADAKHKMGICSTIFLILPLSFSGTTISLLAYQFHLVGVALGVVLFLLGALLCVFSGYLIMEAAVRVNAHSYHELAQLSLKGFCCRHCGKCAKIASAALNCICLIGAAVAGIVFNKNLASSAVRIYD